MAQANLDDLFSMAREHFEKGNFKHSEALLKQLILNNDRHPETFYMLGTIFYDRGQFNKAIKSYKRALELDPTFTDASVGLSVILNDLGKYDEGRQVFESAQTHLGEKKKSRDPMIDERLSRKHVELGDIYFQYERFNEALEQFFKGQKLATRKAEINLRIAQCFLKTNNLARASKELKSLLREDPNFTPARMLLGKVYFQERKIPEAVDLWESVLNREPNHIEAKHCIKQAQKDRLTSLT